MKKDLLIAGALVVFAGLAIGIVVMLPSYFKDDNEVKTVKPRPEQITALKKKEPPKTLPTVKAEALALTPAQEKAAPRTTPAEKKVEPEPKKGQVKVEPEPKKIDPKIEPEPKKEIKKAEVAKIIQVGDDLVKLNDAEGEYTVQTMNRGMKIKLIGVIKTLKIGGANERSVLDVTGLVADEILFTGNLNSGSSVLLGQARSLKIRDLNEGSLLDASALEAREIVLDGAVNSSSTVKLHAFKGTVEIHGEINDRAQIEIAAPAGKVVFKARGDSVINSNAKVTILAKDVEFAGAINGPQTQLDITLTKDGSLKVARLNGGVRCHYRKADATDPDPRIDMGQVDARADFRPLPALKK